MVLLGLDGSVLPWLWADLVDGIGGTAVAGRRHRRRAAAAAAAAVLHRQVVPRVVGPADAADQPAPGARPDRPAPGQQRTPRPRSSPRAATPNASSCSPTTSSTSAIALSCSSSMTLVSGSLVPAAVLRRHDASSPAWPRRCSGRVLERAGRADRRRPGRVRHRAGLVAVRGPHGEARRRHPAGAGPPRQAGRRPQRPAAAGRSRSRCWARSTPSIASGLLPIGAWALYLGGGLSAGATLVAVSTLGSARWFAWTTASLVSQLPSARVWTRRTVAMTGVADVLAPQSPASTSRPAPRRRPRDAAPPPAAPRWTSPASPRCTRTAPSACATST